MNVSDYKMCTYFVKELTIITYVLHFFQYFLIWGPFLGYFDTKLKSVGSHVRHFEQDVEQENAGQRVMS